MIHSEKISVLLKSPLIRGIALILIAIEFGLVLWLKTDKVAYGGLQAGIPKVMPSAQVEKSASDQVKAMIAEADGLKARGRIAEAVVIYEQVLQERPDIAETYFRLGALYFSLGIKSRAEEFYLKAIERDFRDPELYFHLGYIKESEEKFQEALEWYLKAEEKGVGSAELFFNIGNVFARLGNADQAIEYYKKAVVVNPKHADSWINLSIISFKKEQYKDASFYLDKARELGYSPPEEYLKSLSVNMLGK